MTPIGKNSSERSDGNRSIQQIRTSYFLPLQLNKKTIKHADAESRRASKISTSTVEMYLRIRPVSTTLHKSYAVLNSRTLLTFLPFEDKFIRNSRCAKSSKAAEGRRHAFTKIFGSETSQVEMFEGSIKHRVAEFLGGKSSTIMTYGTRDSGKTYTLFGTSASPGIITRGIELVFSAINCTIAPWYKPTFQGTVLWLNETARTSEMQRKIRVLSGRSTDVKQTSAEARKFLENSWPGNADPDKCEECYGESMYAVWLSFAEIYNGNVYDLLDDAETRSPLRLYVNAEGRTYVCGLQKVHAITALEACQILITGQSRMSIVATGLRNSRSHTIFTIELLKYQEDHAAEEVIVSTLTFCDLAGSTQFEKSHMREASNINNSLLVLGRCLKAVSQNQMAPFRQSKLTRICQRALLGEENLSIIVNIVFRPNLSDEMQGIFNFCDIVRKLLINHDKECKQFCDFERTICDLDTCDGNVMASPSSHQSLFSKTEEMTGCIDSTACRNVREQNRRLKQELETVKSDLLNCDYVIRRQLPANCIEPTKKKFSNTSNVDRKNLFESSGSINCSVSRSSDRSKDDSGVSSELQNESQKSISINDNISPRENEDKHKQTCVIDENSQIAMEGNFEQIDCAGSSKWNYQKALHVAELSQDLETIWDVIYALNKTDHAKEALEQFTEEKNTVTIKRNELFKVIENKMQEYKREIYELIHKLAVKDENESRISKCLETYIERSTVFENKLSLMRNRLDKAFSKCASLEEEVLEKTLQISELDGKISKMQHEFAKGYELFQKIHDFEIIVNRCRRDKNELCRQLYECSETQLTLEDKLKKLTMKIVERESEVISLKNEVHNITDLNVANDKKAKNLSEQITEASESIDLAKENLHYCEDLRKNVEDTTKAETYVFRSRLSDDKNNTMLLNEICKTYGDSQDEITRLKMQLEHKELEAALLKTNRDVTIKKYEILMRYFQNEFEEKEKHFKTVANNANNLKRSSTKNRKQLEKVLKDHEAENSFASSFCFIPKHASLEALNVSSVPSEDSIIYSDEKNTIGIKDDDNESCQICLP